MPLESKNPPERVDRDIPSMYLVGTELKELVDRAQTEWIGTSSTYSNAKKAYEASRKLRQRLVAHKLLENQRDLRTRVWLNVETGRFEYALRRR